MHKTEFLKILEESLKGFNEQDKKEILYDYEEHFRIGEESGKDDTEIIRELGDPKNIAKQYKTSTQYDTRKEAVNYDKQNSMRIIALIGLVLFNLTFVLGPFLGIVGTLIALFVSAGALAFSGVALIIGVFVQPFFMQFISIPPEIPHFVLLIIGVGITAVGVLLGKGMYYVCKFMYNITVKYVSWNIKIIKG